MMEGQQNCLLIASTDYAVKDFSWGRKGASCTDLGSVFWHFVREVYSSSACNFCLFLCSKTFNRTVRACSCTDVTPPKRPTCPIPLQPNPPLCSEADLCMLPASPTTVTILPPPPPHNPPPALPLVHQLGTVVVSTVRLTTGWRLSNVLPRWSVW